MLNRLLVTGAAGGVGKAIRPHLAKLARHVRLSDIEAIDNAEQHEEVQLDHVRLVLPRAPCRAAARRGHGHASVSMRAAAPRLPALSRWFEARSGAQ